MKVELKPRLALIGPYAFDVRNTPMNLNPIDLLEKAINEHGSSTILREHLALLKSQLSKLEAEASVLQSEKLELQLKIKALQSEAAYLQSEVKKHKPSKDDFHQFGGVLWKRSGNVFDQFPYCPQCPEHTVMYGQPPVGGDPMLWQCSKCRFIAPFSGRPK